MSSIVLLYRDAISETIRASPGIRTMGMDVTSDKDEETSTEPPEGAGEESAADGGEEVGPEGGWLGRYPGIEAFWERLAPYAQPLYFAGGVVFDAVTLGSFLNIWTLGYVFLYAVGVGVCMVARARRWFETRREWVDNALHFCLGATFSALIALYFRSASTLWGWVTVLLLVGVMVWNEWAAKGRPRRSLVWAVYAASLVMLFNFLLPYLFGTVSSIWFYTSVALVMGTLYGLRHIARIPSLSLGASGAFSVVLVGLYIAGAIPPVPLVMRQNVACVDGRRANGRYVCEGTEPGWLASWGLGDVTVRYVPGERVSVLSAVSAPRGVSSTLEHRWARWEGGRWKTYDTIEVEMTGGRRHGWRFYSYKRQVRPGQWRVATAVPDGRVVGYVHLRLEEVSADQRPERRELELR